MDTDIAFHVLTIGFNGLSWDVGRSVVETLGGPLTNQAMTQLSHSSKQIFSAYVQGIDGVSISWPKKLMKWLILLLVFAMPCYAQSTSGREKKEITADDLDWSAYATKPNPNSQLPWMLAGSIGVVLITAMASRRIPNTCVAASLCILALAFAYPPLERVIEPSAFEMHQGKRTPKRINSGFIFIGSVPLNGHIINSQWAVHLAFASLLTGGAAWWAANSKRKAGA